MSMNMLDKEKETNSPSDIGWLSTDKHVQSRYYVSNHALTHWSS